MVVDDVQSNRELFARLLKRRGVLSVHMAENGAHALTVYDKLSPDDVAQLQAIFMDKEMPVMDGHAAATAFRSRGIKLPIIGLTGNALEEDRRLFIDAGATAVLTKPVRVDAVQAALSILGLQLAAARARPGLLPPPPLIDEPFAPQAPADSAGSAELPREAEALNAVVASIEAKAVAAPLAAAAAQEVAIAEPELAVETGEQAAAALEPEVAAPEPAKECAQVKTAAGEDAQQPLELVCDATSHCL
jgi:CheY-like chemotaxis protein